MKETRLIELEGTCNTRDIGGYASENNSLIKWSRFFRSDNLHAISDSSMNVLVSKGLNTVIDLRRSDETVDEPNRFEKHDSVKYYNISFFEDLFPKENFEGDVLLDIYLEALENRKDKVAQVMNAIADAPEGAVLFHCSVGKDRTGLIASLLLGLAGVSRKDILEDYNLTAKYIKPRVDALMQKALYQGMNVEEYYRLMLCEQSTMQKALEHLDQKYSSTENYLIDVGLSPATINKIKLRLLK